MKNPAHHHHPPSPSAPLVRTSRKNDPSRSSPSSIRDLPDEILLSIFSTVHPRLTPLDHAHLSATCRRFRRLAEDRTLWRRVSLEPFRSLIDDRTIEILVRTRFRAVTGEEDEEEEVDEGVISTPDFPTFDPGGGEVRARAHAGRLQSLDLSKCSNVTDVGVATIAGACPGLMMLDLTECVKVGDGALRELGRECGRLRDLRLLSCADVTDRGVLALVNGGPTQEKEEEEGSEGDNDDGEEGWRKSKHARSSTSLSRPPFSSLQYLDLSWCDKVTDASLEAIGLRCPHIHTLKLSFGGVGITDEGIASLLRTKKQENMLDDLGRSVRRGKRRINEDEDVVYEVAESNTTRTDESVTTDRTNAEEVVKEAAVRNRASSTDVLSSRSSSSLRSKPSQADVSPSTMPTSIVNPTTTHPEDDLHLHPLRILEASMNQNITCRTLRTLTAHAPMLEDLVVTWCERISPEAVREFRKRRPACRVAYSPDIF